MQKQRAVRCQITVCSYSDGKVQPKVQLVFFIVTLTPANFKHHARWTMKDHNNVRVNTTAAMTVIYCATFK